MLILALESSAKAASAALCRDGVLVAQTLQCSGLTHSRTLLPMAEDLMKNAGVTLDEVGGIAVAHGPGSFTGIRIGVAAAKGLAWGAEKPVLGVSTLEAMAWNGAAAGEGTEVCAVMDARRNQVYQAAFEIRDGKPARLCEDRAVSLEELCSELEKTKKRIFLVGDGAALCYNICLNKGIPAMLAPSNLVHQSAWGVAMAARGRTFGTADALLPAYLRLSQAERERQARLARKPEENNERMKEKTP